MNDGRVDGKTAILSARDVPGADLMLAHSCEDCGCVVSETPRPPSVPSRVYVRGRGGRDGKTAAMLRRAAAGRMQVTCASRDHALGVQLLALRMGLVILPPAVAGRAGPRRDR